MAQYDFNMYKMKTNPDFLEFLQNEYNFQDTSTLTDYELEGLIYKFKYQKNDIDPQDQSFLDDIKSCATGKDEVTDAYFPGKKYDELSEADKAFVAITCWHLEDKQINPASLKTQKNATLAGLVQAVAENKTAEKASTVENTESTVDNQTVGVSTAETATQRNQTSSRAQETKQDPNAAILKTEENRLRSETNLEEDSALAKLRMETLRDEEIISAEDYDKHLPGFNMDADLKDANEAWEFLDGSEEKISDERAYKRDLADKVINAGEQRLLTPELASEALENVNAQLQKDPENEDLKRKQAVLLDTMDRLTDNFIRERDYYLLDVTNIADAYSGYTRMFKMRLNELDRQNKELDNKLRQDADNGELKAQKEETQKQIETYEKCQQNLDILMQPYDEKWNIPDGNNPRSTAIRLNDRIRKYTDELGKIKYNEETLGTETMQMISRFKFRGEQGNIPQFYDPENPEVKSDTWKEGMAVLPGSRLETVLNLVKNDILMTNLNTDKEISAENITVDLRDGIGEKLFEIYNSEEKVLGAVENPRKFVEPEKEKYLNEFMTRLNNPEQPLGISELGYQAAMNVQANNVEVYAHRLSEKLGANNSEYVRSVLFEQMENIDRRAPLHERSKSIKNKALKRAIFGTAIGAGIAYVGARVLTNAGVTGGASLTFSTTAATVAAIGIGIGATALQYYLKRKEARANGDRHYNFKKFIKDKNVQVALGATMLGAAALVFAKVNAPEVAAGCAIGSFGLGVGLRFAQPYRDMRLKGHNKLAAFAMAAVSASATLGAGLLGRHHALNDIQPFSHTVKAGTERIDTHLKGYSDEINAKAEIWNNSDGISHGARYTADGLAPSESVYHKSGNYEQILDNVQKSMSGWEADAAKTNLAKLENAFRLGSPDTPLTDGSGRTLGDVMGYVNPQTGKHTNYNDVLQHLLNEPSKPLNHDEVQVMEQVALHMGAGKGDKMGHLIPDVGIKKEELFSYDTERPHGILDKVTSTFRNVYKTVTDKVTAITGLIGWAHRDGGAKEKFRPGAKADRVEERKTIVGPGPRPGPDPEPIPPRPDPEPIPPRPDPEPIPPRPDPEPEPEPKPDPIDDVKDLMIDEYKIVYGTDPIVEGDIYKNYCDRVEKERQAEAPDMSMNDYLLARRAELDKMILGEETKPGETYLGDNSLLTGENKTKYQNNYRIKKMQDDRGRAAFLNEARENLMQSNLTRENYIGKMTLTHFKKFVRHYAANDEVVSDGSRDISLNPVLKDKYKKEGSKILLTDLNQYLIEGKPLEQCQKRVNAQEAREQMQDFQGKGNPRKEIRKEMTKKRNKKPKVDRDIKNEGR